MIVFFYLMTGLQFTWNRILKENIQLPSTMLVSWKKLKIAINAYIQCPQTYTTYQLMHRKNFFITLFISFSLCRGNYQGEILGRSYTRSFNGFSAYLTKQEQQKLAVLCNLATLVSFNFPDF